MDFKGQQSTEYSSELVERVETSSDHVFLGEDLHWWKQPGLRRLYLLIPFLFLGSTTLGYDGSLLNGLQAMPTWQECMFRMSPKLNVY